MEQKKSVTPVAPSGPTGPKGRFLGVVATGKELYQVHLLETVDGRIVTREVIDPGRENLQNGKKVSGNSLAVASAALMVAVSRKLIGNASSLWQP